MTQTNLGYTLVILGEREGGSGRFEEAMAACHEALKEYTRERVPLQWAETKNNLGNALLRLGLRTHDPAKLEEARKAVNAAFEVFMQAGQEHRRRYFEDRLRELDRQLAVQ